MLLFFGISSIIFSQEYNYKHYTVEDGLSSSEVYSAFQDSKGYMWFATDAGVSRFNGYEFKNYDSKDGLTDNTVFLIREDSKGRIWFGTFNKKLCYFYNDSIYPFEYNEKISRIMPHNAVLDKFVIDKNNFIWMGFKEYGILRCSPKGSVELLTNDYEYKLMIYEVEEEPVLALLLDRKEHVEKLKKNVLLQQDIMIEYHGKNNNVSKGVVNINFSLDNISPVFSNIQFQKVNDKYLCFFGDSLAFFNLNKNIISTKMIGLKGLFHNRIYSSTFFDDYLWVCIENEGIYKFKVNNEELILEQNILINKLCSRIFKDKDGGCWITTLRDGVYYIKNTLFKNDDNVISSIDIDSYNKFVYLGLKDRRLMRKSIKSNHSTPYEVVINFEELHTTLVYDNKEKNILSDGFLGCLGRINNDGTLKKFDVNNPSSKSIIIDSNVIYRVNSSGISKIVDGKEVHYSSISNSKLYWCTSLVKDKKNIWVGTNQGLVCFDDETYKITEPFKNNKLLSTGITCIEKLNNNIILIGTKSFGLLLMQNEKVIAVIGEKKGLTSDLVRCIHIDNQNEIWVGTNKGLSRLNYKSLENFNIQHITTKHGLISNEISHIRSYKNIIYLATPKGLIEFDKTNLTINKIPSPIYITKFKVNDVVKDLKKNPSIELSYDENRIDIHFESLNYKSLGDIDYKYRLLDIDTTWQSTAQTTVSFYALPPDNYTFEVKAQNEDGFWSKPATYSFKIKPPFWLTWWFIGFEVVFIILVLMIIFKYRETQLLIKSKNLQRITENEKKIMELELKALKSQMNPHFIFNTLNSIQHFISSNNFKDSNRYITNFSKLIRMVLNQSDKSFITLREETEMLNLYLSLEQVRFSNEFEFVLNLDDSIDLDFDKIPPMLLQPFVENAIWHGLMNKKEKGHIEIKFAIDGDYLLCTVTDNGIGRVAAEEIKATRKIQNKSVGITITKERLNIINSEMYENMNIKVIDLYDKNNLPTGTTVKIKIALT